ncbi:MAG: DUF3134 domain-containing protein [Symploca sp. SIO2E9]|nr:DUF3134 domain-containing protein [Symploca sp. SIO2E9]
MDNPSLRSEPREQLAQVIRLKQETSLLDWLEANGRLLERDPVNEGEAVIDSEEEISELMGVDDHTYDEDDDGDSLDD